MDSEIYNDIVKLLKEGYDSQEIVDLYACNPAKVTLTKVGAVRMSLQKKYKTSKLDPKPNGLIEWLKADKLFK